MALKKIFSHNWLAIVYLNFKLLPLKQAIKFPIDVYGKIRIPYLSGNFILESKKISTGMIKIGTQGSDMFSHQETIISIRGTIVAKGKLVIGIGSSIISNTNSIITFGENTIIGARNLIFCENNIDLGCDFLTSWDCQIMDTDTHKIIDKDTNKSKPYVGIIKTGNHIWLGNGVVVNKGSILPSNTIVASRSLCNKNYSSVGEHCILAGTPAKVVSTNKIWEI